MCGLQKKFGPLAGIKNETQQKPERFRGAPTAFIYIVIIFILHEAACSGSQLLDDNMLAADDLVTSEGTKIKISDKVNTLKKTWKIQQNF